VDTAASVDRPGFAEIRATRGLGARAIQERVRATRVSRRRFTAPSATSPQEDDVPHSVSLRFALCIALLPVLANLGSAQGTFVGGTGNSVVQGSTGPDDISDPSPGDSDQLIDGPFGGGINDGEPDRLDSRDGDNNDSMSGGPEDAFVGDPGDFVKISIDGTLLWQGPYSEYIRIRRMYLWLRDLVTARPLPYPTWSTRKTYWLNTLTDWTSSLAGLEPLGEWTDLAELCPLGSGDDDTDQEFDPWSPAGCMEWMPMHPGDNSDPELLVSADELAILVGEVQPFIDFALDQLALAPSDPD
jgi:hypothetical protein